MWPADYSFNAVRAGKSVVAVPYTMINCDSPRELLDALASWNSWAHQTVPRSWIYRGQGKNAWPLVPTALRPDKRDELHRIAGEPTYDRGALTNQIGREKRVLRKFMDAAYSAGLPIPGDFFEALRYLVTEETDLFGYPSSSLWEIAGLAQHHGIPTRLLDWTYNWRMAAYFAAKCGCGLGPGPVTDSCCRGEDDGNLVVWALNAEKLTVHARTHPMQQFSGLALSTHPKQFNPNLRAQDGVFTVFIPHHTMSEMDGMSFEDILPKVIEGWTTADTMRLTLPRRESRALLRMLAVEGVTAVSAYPSYDGVAELVRETIVWHDRDSDMIA